MNKPLLPTGCYDILPPQAEKRYQRVQNLLSYFSMCGYASVLPPLLEFSESLLQGSGTALSEHLFRVMDPHARKVMGVRADITGQIARIASTRLHAEARPLRLAYAGEVLRMQSRRGHGKRQLTQVGIECIGVHSPAADAEVILVAKEALRTLDLDSLIIDLHHPSLATLLLADDTLSKEEHTKALQAIAAKDSSTISAMNLTWKDALLTFLHQITDMDVFLKRVESTPLPERVRDELSYFTDLLNIIRPQCSNNLEVSIDLLEQQGVDYHTGITFSIFSKVHATELGRGGHYQITGINGAREEATGFTLYIDLLPETHATLSTVYKKVYALTSPGSDDSQKLVSEGYRVIHALHHQDITQEAKRLGADYVWQDGKLSAV